jgi:hypothetical protein
MAFLVSVYSDLRQALARPTRQLVFSLLDKIAAPEAA